MSRNERWNTADEIKRLFHETTDPQQGAGPIVLVDNKRKYSADGESHIAVIGRTGTGKSQCCTNPYIREILNKGESLIMLDPKGDVYKKNACYIPDNYQVFCVDFRVPRKSPTRWNPLSTPYRLYISEDQDENDVASSMISELWSEIYPYDGHSDKFWPDAAANYAKGLTYGLFETANEEDINLDSIAVMMEQSEIRKGLTPLVKDFYSCLPTKTLSRRCLATYVTAPDETRASIHSVADSGMEVFSRSKGLMEMLSEDTLNIMDIDINRPFVLAIITPDETNVYDAISGILISQVTQHLIRVAQEIGGRLPIRVNIILEELGSVGKCIPSLANLMVASRSRNIRLMLVLQSFTQLIDVYGKSKAETIISSIGITIGFSTNCWETLEEWSQRCGERQVETDRNFYKEKLITAPQLAAMPTGTALVMIDNRYKYISSFPLYDQMYDNSNWKAPVYRRTAKKKHINTFDFMELVKSLQELRISTERQRSSDMKTGNRNASSNPGSSRKEDHKENNDFLARLEAHLAELEKKEIEEEEKEKKKKLKLKYCVTVMDCSDHKQDIARIISNVTGEKPEHEIKVLENCPIKFSFSNKTDATRLAREINKAGGIATVTSIQ